MPSLATFLDTVSTVLAWRLQSDAALREVAVFEERTGFVTNDVLNALGVLNTAPLKSKTGACVIVKLPRIVENRSEGPQAELWVELTIKIHEMPVLNYGATGTGKSAASILASVFELLKDYGADTLGQAVTLKNVPEGEGGNENGEVVRVAQFRMLAPPLAQRNCDAPAVTVHDYDGGVGGWAVTATTATSGGTVKLLIIAADATLTLDPDLADWTTAPGLITEPGDWRILAVTTKAGLQMSGLVDRIVTVTQPALQFVEGGDMSFVQGGKIGEL